MSERTDRYEPLMERTGLGLLPGLVLALGLIVFAMAALLTGSMWAVVGLLVLIGLVTAALVYVVVAVASDGEEAARMRRHIPGLSGRR
jgi:hypothetical protein